VGLTENPSGEQSGSAGAYPLEQAGPLSQSILWRMQRRYFERSGIAAWSEGAVPMWVTSNPFIAAAYARVIGAYWRDCLAVLDSKQPLYIVELGAGSGRLAYHLMRSLMANREQNDKIDEAGLPAFRYVMTEYNPALLDFWAAHPALQPLAERGWLDFARFDADQPADLHLQHSGITLSAGSLANPLVLVANYFFDSIPQDAFYVEDGRLYESQATVRAREPGLTGEEDDILGRVQLSYERLPASLPYYGKADLDSTVDLDDLLDQYRQVIKAGALVFPNTGLRCLAHFRRMAAKDGNQERLLLLTADKGYHRPEDLQGRREPGFEVHGSFSMGVNYDALARYCQRQGGAALTLPHRHLYLDTCAFLLGDYPSGLAGTRAAYGEMVGEFGPEDFYLLQGMLNRDHSALGAEQVLALLRLSRWDPKIYHAAFADLLDGLTDASAGVRAELRAGAARVWDNYYHIGEQYDLPYDLGVLLYKLGEYSEALGYFKHSLALHGAEAKTLYNVSLCQYLSGDRVAALRSAAQASVLDPAFEPARALAAKIQTELG
jgi:hypothetical protein